MKISTKTKLALLFLALACFIGVMTSLLVNSLITNQIIKEAQERVIHDLDTARYVYSMRVREIDRAIRWASIRHILKRALRDRNVGTIREELTTLMVEEKLDFLTLTDRKGIVVYRVHNPEVAGDSLIHQPSIRKALERRRISGTEVLTREDLLREGEALANRAALKLIPTPKARPPDRQEETSGLVLRSTHPILDFNGEVLGTVSGGLLLNRNEEIVDQIKNIVFKDAKYRGKDVGTATIFLKDVRVATNVLDREGKRALGTLAMREVQEQVLEKGLPWTQRAFVVDDWYITAYEPIRDIEERIVGILYVGLLESRYTLMKERLILLFFLLSMSAMLVALTISFLLSWRVQKKLLRKEGD